MARSIGSELVKTIPVSSDGIEVKPVFPVGGTGSLARRTAPTCSHSKPLAAPGHCKISAMISQATASFRQLAAEEESFLLLLGIWRTDTSEERRCWSASLNGLRLALILERDRYAAR